ncbi:HDOD domain-containing protein [Desulfofustis glycolicus]|uniref:HD-like signal output (HDOD) domain, no enzymatic activity n=1 Tax=Desulfofustis glycolicus DSM 9705 TaxID=1121409 RepID=A0A1M5Y0X5_9BACT|nr:HDOD domain-containing protein [Desulfofustis glycolicus]SHI05721.1 HD-like signal output (HDOD) domain, no enzymatic activity [Desulfofustis glycolicus DSM 9705]
MMTTSRQPSIDKQLEALPPLPLTVSQVMQITADPLSSANDLMKAILPDQAMCLTILKIANSALYGRPKKVASLESAIVVLGFDEIRNIVLGKAAVTTFRNIFKTRRAELEKFWDHAFTCGLAARIVAEHLGLQSGQFFIAGLLHDFGKLAMLLTFENRYDANRWFTEITTTTQLARERELFSTTHAEVGSKLLHHWQFPDTLISALRYHHTPGQAGKMIGYALVVQLADFLAHCCALPERPDDRALKELLDLNIPGFLDSWHERNLPWEEMTLEYLFAWLAVDRKHGSSILDILASS